MLKIESRSTLSVPCRRWETGLAGDPNKPCLSLERYAGRIDFDNYQLDGVRLLIPTLNLFGTQTRTEYDSRKERSVEAKLKICGLDCLKEHPVPVCALSDGNRITLAIIDGHHRVRYAGRFRISTIPCVIYTPTQLVDIFNRHMVYNRLIDETFLMTDLQEAVRATLLSFDSSLPECKRSRIIPAVNVDDLEKNYQSF